MESAGASHRAVQQNDTFGKQLTYFLDTGAPHMGQDIVDDETREEDVATSWNYLHAILKSVDPNQSVHGS